MLPAPSVSAARIPGKAVPALSAARARLNSRLFILLQITPACLPPLSATRYSRTLVRRISILLVICSCSMPAQNQAAQNEAGRPWKFAVSGDSRNCGDIVMPVIAAGVHKSGAVFYWHLGDFRAIYRLDEDMSPPVDLGLHNQPLETLAYLKEAWPDFISHQ